MALDSLEAGRAFVDLVPRMKGDMGQVVEQEAKRSRLGPAMGGIGRVAGKALVGGVGAAFAAGVKGTIDFAGFQQQMNEVFTLLPGISGPAMDKMTGQVKDFSKEFGVLPDKVVPALYSSLSAGVPPGNVFDFLEVAQKAAKGGVTELETAVDGISSVVNAYGDDVIEAGEASDLMFTAVRLGKTTFDELSSSLSNVTPIASGLGVNFSDLTAGLATMTAQGTPTAQATTQLRSLFVELSKAGGATANVFEDIAGKTFQEFIAEGGNTADALALLGDHADDSGVQIQDLFGSVEAGSAALSLTSSDSFVSNIEEMGDAAGATEKAYEQMDTGLGAIFEKLKARAAVFSLEIGERIAPFLEKGIELTEKWGPILLESLGDAFDQVREMVAPVVEIVGKVIDAFSILGGDDGVQGFAEIMDNALGNSGKWVGFFRSLGEWILKVGDFIRANLKPILVTLGAAFLLLTAPVSTIVAGLVLAYQRFEGFRNVVDAVVRFLVTQIVPRVTEFATYVAEQFGNLVAWVREHWASIQEAIGHVVNVIRAIVTGFVDAVLIYWGYFGDTILTILAAAWENVRAVVEFAVALVAGIIETAVALINGDWGAAWDAFTGIFGAAWELVKTLLGNALEVVKSLLGSGLDVARDLVSGALDKIVGFFRDLPGRLAGAAGDVFGFLWQSFRGAINKVIDGWNDLEFKIPGFDPPGPGPKFGGFTLGLPPVPRLAEGGTALERGLAIVGEGSYDGELVDLPAGAVVTPLDTAAMIAEAAGAAGAQPSSLFRDVIVPTATDATADEVVDAILTKAGWKLTTRNDGRA